MPMSLGGMRHMPRAHQGIEGDEQIKVQATQTGHGDAFGGCSGCLTCQR